MKLCLQPNKNDKNMIEVYYKSTLVNGGMYLVSTIHIDDLEPEFVLSIKDLSQEEYLECELSMVNHD